MVIFDTDHISVMLQGTGSQYSTISGRLLLSVDRDFATTAITVEETLRGWLSRIRRARSRQDEVPPYSKLVETVQFYGGWKVAGFSVTAADVFDDLRRQKIRIGTMDLKIASIALAENALLLSANLGDFQLVPGLQVENWMH